MSPSLRSKARLCVHVHRNVMRTLENPWRPPQSVRQWSQGWGQHSWGGSPGGCPEWETGCLETLLLALRGRIPQSQGLQGVSTTGWLTSVRVCVCVCVSLGPSEWKQFQNICQIVDTHRFVFIKFSRTYGLYFFVFFFLLAYFVFSNKPVSKNPGSLI